MKNSIDISTKSILRILLLPTILYVVWVNRDLVFALFIAFILMSALRPIVMHLHVRRKVPMQVAAILVIIVSTVSLGLLVGSIIPPMLSETIQFIERLPEIFRSINPSISQYIQIQQLSQYVPTLANQFVSIVGNVFSNTLLVFMTVFFSYYLLANERTIDEGLIQNFFGRHFKADKIREILRILHAAQARLAAWFWGELILMLAVGVLSYIGFSWIGIKYALPLAVLAGVLEILPNLGPTITALIATFIGFGQSPVTGFAALAVSFVVQQLENYLLVPYIMKKVVGLNPIVTILVVILGMRFGGPLGALLAIPTYVLAESIYREIYTKRA